MPRQQSFRHYVAFKSNDALRKAHAGGSDAIARHLRDVHSLTAVSARNVAHSVPSMDWEFRAAGTLSGLKSADFPDQHLISLHFEDTSAAEELRNRVTPHPDVLGMGADLPILPTNFGCHVCPGAGADPIFGRRKDANRLINAEWLWDLAATGKNVYVVVVDQGVDARLIEKNFGGGWKVGDIEAGSVRGGHGAMIARNILAVAPDATIVDCPVIPPRITNIPKFLVDIAAIYERMRTDIARWRQTGEHQGHWVFVNAWAVFDRKSEHQLGDYTEKRSHHFNQMVGEAARKGSGPRQGFDFVFCAGNCGQFCPDPRCGARDRGPRNSIFGANSHPSVLTVGAVRSDSAWLGYSSQGPGQPDLANRKPDLCAPSQFCEDHDAHLTNSGTSAAAGIAAGIVAGLRSVWGPGTVAPGSEGSDSLIQRLNYAAGSDWNERFGHGIINAEAAFTNLNDSYPAVKGPYP